MDQTGGTELALHEVAIVIKALNEARYIRACVESALIATQSLTCQVILADSGSTDSTVDIASEYPIIIVQFEDETERSCGAGGQLGFQFVAAEFLYILDGDMELDPEFIGKAIKLMRADASLAGVGGVVEECGAGNYEFRVRKMRKDGAVLGDSSSLDMGGLYRASAVRASGYFTNRNLHSYEEKELGFRLRKLGYRLTRIDVPSVRHHGKIETTKKLLSQRWKSGHLDGPGEWLRSTVSFRDTAQIALIFFPQLVAVLLMWTITLLSIIRPTLLFPLALALHASVFVLFLYRLHSVRMAAIAYLNLSICSFAMLRGWFRPQFDPAMPIRAKRIK